MVAIIVALAVCQVNVLFGEMTALIGALNIIVDLLLWLSAVLCVVSGAIYLYDNREFVNTAK